jgi:serine/threonine-protein kinase
VPRASGGGWLRDRDWFLALSLAFAVGVIVWFAHAVTNFFGPSEQSVLVPTVVGQTLADAQAEAARLNLAVQVIANQPSDRFPKDVVMQQQPAAGARVREGRQLSLIVSTGVSIFPMPDLRFLSLREATLDLGHAKLALAKTTVAPNDDVPAGHVLAQDPVPLAGVHEGTRVSLTLSKGPPGSVKVPDFVGESVDDARADAARAKTHLGQIVWTPFGPSGPSRGTIVRQRPGAGESIDPFSPVSLQVSAGPTEYGYLVRQVHATATVPSTYQSANVRIEVRDQTGTWNVYDGYAQGGQRLDFTITSIGTAELDTYINNELLNQTQLGDERPRPSPSPAQEPKP